MAYSRSSFLSCLLVLAWMRSAECSIQLQVPRECKYIFDCGVGNLNIKPETQVNISWGVDCFHDGGYKIIMLIPSEEIVAENSTEPQMEVRTLIPSNPRVEWANIRDDPKYQLVNVPRIPECQSKACYIRLVPKQNDDTDYVDSQDVGFLTKSCTDIVAEVCNGRGEWLSSEGKCRCDNKFGGDFCEEWISCKRNADCGGRGQCYDKKCFCEFGWFGDNCQRRSKFQTKRFSTTDYIQSDLSTLTARWGPTMYWNLERNMLEVVLEAHTTSWVSLGWRPADGSHSCSSFGDYDYNEFQDFQNPTACTDMVVGIAKGDKGYIGDYFSQGNDETPKRDEFWGGKDDLESGTVFEQRGKTYMMFRKRVKTGDNADLPFGGKMDIVWAYGQDLYRDDLSRRGDGINSMGIMSLYFTETRRIEFGKK